MINPCVLKETQGINLHCQLYYCLHIALHIVLNRISRTERSGRYGSEQPHDDPEWNDRRDRDQDRDHMRRCNDDRRGDRFEDRRGSRDSPEVVTSVFTVLSRF